MGKVKRFFRQTKIKRAIIFLPLLIFAFVCLFVFKSLNTKADTIYKLITDSNGITWQYGYNATNKELEVSFFESNNTITEITIPDKSYFIENDTSIATVNNYKFTNYNNYNLGTPKEFDSIVTSIDLSNVNVVNGIKPLSNNSSDVVMNITLNPTSSRIGNDVFRELKINISNLDKVTYIGGGAFYHTTFSNTVISLPNLKSLGSGSFETSNVTEVTLDYVESGVSAFKNCKDLESVVLLDNVTVINNSMFEGDSSLSSFDFNHVKTVNNDAFKDCTSWNNDIKDTEIETLGTGVFWGTTGFTKEVTIPDKVTFLGWKVFSESNISGINLNNVTEIYGEAFLDCLNLSKIDFGKVEKINYKAFANDAKLSEIKFTPSVYYIGTQAFENCLLDKVDFGSVEKIEYKAFANNNLTELYLPKTIVVLEAAKIFVNNKIEKITIAYDTLSDHLSDLNVVLDNSYWDTPSTSLYVKEINLIAPYGPNEEAKIKSKHYDVKRKYKTNFGDKSGLSHRELETGKNVEMDPEEDVKNLDIEAYKNVLQSLYIHNFYNMERLTVGDGYEFLGSHSVALRNYNFLFYGDWTESSYKSFPDTSKFHLSNISLPSTLKGIGINAFTGSLNASNVTINLPESLEYIGRGAFRSCWGLKNEIDLPNLKYLGDFAFQGTGITKIALRNKLEHVGRTAFNHTLNLKSVIIDCDYFKISRVPDIYEPEYFWDSSYNNFNNSIYMFRYYEKDSTDYNFDLVKFTKNVKTLPKDPSIGYTYTYNGNQYTTSQPQSNSLFWLLKAKEIDLEECPWTEMGSHDFQEIIAETVKLPKNLTKINEAMFYKARVKNPIVLPETVTSIGKSAFAGSTVIISNNLPKNLETIGDAAFYNSKINDNIIVPSSVKSIGKSAFATCESDYPYACVESYSSWNNDNVVSRNSITFENKLDVNVTNGSTISELLWNSSVNEIKFGDNVTELPTKTLNKDKSVDESKPEFYNLDVKKVTFNNLIELPKKAFIDNKNIEEVTFSEDPNLTKIGSHAFYGTTNLNKLKLYHDLDLTIDDHAFHGSGLTSLNDSEGIDVNSDKITLTGDCAFQNMPNILSLEISNKLNNGIIPEGTFADNTNLEKVILEDGVTNINSGAFANTNNLKTFVMYGNTDIANKDKNQTITLKNINNINFYSNSLIKNNFSIKANNSVVVTNNDLVYNESTKNYEFKYEFAGDITLTTTDDIIMKKDQYNNIYIEDMNDYNTTISSTANLYCYLKNPHCNDWNNTYKSYKEKEDSDLYYLDEVLYLDSNQVSVKLINNGKDIKKDGLSLYALRRDGVILISDDWGKMTDAKMYVDSGITIRNYDSNTTDPRKIIFNTNRDFDKLDLTTNSNFDEVTYIIGEEDPITGKTNVEFIYSNVVVDTTAETTLKSSGSYADIIYSDGCGGEAFSNVIYEDVKIGDPTPKYNGVPTREGYEFIGWNTEISDTVEGDVIYTAKWKKIDNNYPIINKDIPTINDGLINPPTTRNIIYLISILTIIIISIAFRRSFVKRNS